VTVPIVEIMAVSHLGSVSLFNAQSTTTEIVGFYVFYSNFSLHFVNFWMHDRTQMLGIRWA